MIEIGKGIKKGDLVYAWYRQIKPGKGDKPVEAEYRVSEMRPGWLKLESLGGGYWIVLEKELLENWHGNVRKMK